MRGAPVRRGTVPLQLLILITILLLTVLPRIARLEQADEARWKQPPPSLLLKKHPQEKDAIIGSQRP